jgi:hypothetical protein
MPTIRLQFSKPVRWPAPIVPAASLTENILYTGAVCSVLESTSVEEWKEMSHEGMYLYWNIILKPGTVADAYHPSTQETEAGDSQGQPGLHKFKVNLVTL